MEAFEHASKSFVLLQHNSYNQKIYIEYLAIKQNVNNLKPKMLVLELSNRYR